MRPSLRQAFLPFAVVYLPGNTPNLALQWEADSAVTSSLSGRGQGPKADPTVCLRMLRDTRCSPKREIGRKLLKII